MPHVLIVPSLCDSLLHIKLPEPKTGKLQQYFYDEKNIVLYESTRFHDKFRSWLLDNKFSKDGIINMLTKIDSLFIFLPIIQNLASKQFRTLDDICSTYATSFEQNNGTTPSIEHALSPEINWENICETKEVDSELYVKYDESKTLDWLEKKHIKCMDALKDMLDGESSKATLLSYACDLIDIYLPEFISDKFKSRAKNIPVPEPTKSKPNKNLGKRSTEGDDSNNIKGKTSTVTNGDRGKSTNQQAKVQKLDKGQASIRSFFTKKS